MDAALKAKIDELGGLFEEYKTSNDAAIDVLKKTGTVPTDLEDRLVKMDLAIDSLQSDITEARAGERLDNFEATLNRLGLSGGGSGGSQIITPEMQEYAQAFNQYLRKGRGEEMLEEMARKASLSTESDPDGGFTVLPQVDTEIARIQSNLSAMRDIARVIPISANQYEKIVNLGGSTAGWVGEKESRPQTANSVFSKIIIEAMEMYSQPAATQAMLDDSFMNVEGWLAEENAIDFDELEGASFVSGDGIGKPRGFLDYDTVANASYAWGKLGFIKTGVDGGFPIAANGSGDPLIDLVYSLRAALRGQGKFIMNGLTQAAVRKLKDENSNYIWQPGLIEGQPATLLGYGISEDDNMPDIATNSFSIAFGNFMRGYTIVDRMGIRVLRDPLTNKPFILFYTTKRTGGGVTDFEAIKLLKFAA